MKKFSLTIFTFIYLVLFSACDIPLYTQYQVKNYLDPTEKNFTESKEQFKKIEEAIFAGNSHYKETKSSVDEAFAKIKDCASALDEKNTSNQTQSPHQDLKKYYEDLLEFTEEVKLMVDLLFLAEKTADDFIASVDKLPNNFSASTDKLTKEFTQKKKDYEKELEDLKNQEVPDNFHQAKVALISVMEAFNSYLESVIEGLQVKDASFFAISRFTRQMDGGFSRFSSQIEIAEVKGKFDTKMEKLKLKETNLDNQIKELKNKYKIE